MAFCLENRYKCSKLGSVLETNTIWKPDTIDRPPFEKLDGCDDSKLDVSGYRVITVIWPKLTA